MSSPVHYPDSESQSRLRSESPETQRSISSHAKRHHPNSQREQTNSDRPSQNVESTIFADSQLSQINSQQFSQNENLQRFRNAQIWGTDIAVETCMSQFALFLREYRENSDSSPKYIELLQDIEENQIYHLMLNCKDLLSFNTNLYRQLVSYPQELLPLFDEEVNNLYRRKFPDDSSFERIQVKPFNLEKISRMRDIDPEDIDCLIAFKSMVTRVSAVIPEMKIGFFRCSKCAHETQIEVDRGRVAHPKACENTACKTRDSYSLVHNRSVFSDKQLVRAQETPETIPEGETPQTVEIFCYSDLIDSVKPGDRLIVTGVYRAVSIRVSRLQRNLKALYRGYVDALHFKKTLKHSFKVEEKSGEKNSEEGIDEKRLREISEDPEIYQKLVNSIAPSIWELEDVKRGLLCQLFGGVAKKRENKSFFRSEINVLLCGDPGTSKSQLLQYVHKISPRGIYTSGKGSSAVGLTASISRDPETRETVLESGALVLSDRGVCCIDEFDKMSDSARSVLHEVMEQQTISVAKAGVICTLNARTSVLAAANPHKSRYDAAMSVVDNITLPPALLSRFDLIYIVLDKPNERLDRKLAQHLIGLYKLEQEQKERDFLDAKTFAAYVALARKEVNPVITEEASNKLIEGYLKMRRIGRFRNKKVIAATPRQLESLIRISEALARMRFSREVLEEDVDEAFRLMKVATQSAATDPRTGIINMDLLSVDQNAMERKEAQAKVDLLLDIMDEESGGRPFSFLMAKFNEKADKTLNFSGFKELINQMESRNLVSCRDWLKKDPVISSVED